MGLDNIATMLQAMLMSPRSLGGPWKSGAIMWRMGGPSRPGANLGSLTILGGSMLHHDLVGIFSFGLGNSDPHVR